MYETFYGLTERPFSLLPDPDFLYLSEKHRTALDLLELAIFSNAGFCVISGEIGTGKTTLIRELLNRLNDDIRVGLVANTHPDFGELLHWILAAYGLQSGNDDVPELHKHFIDFVIQQYAEGKHTLLIIDEAQNLSVAAMEQLRMLSNVNSDKDLVLQVILVGQQQLRDKLRQPELAQFAQRVAVDYHLTGLDEKQTRDYIRFRVTHAGGAPDIFSDEACKAVYRSSGGVPRLINRLCDLSLVYGYAEASPRITAQLVDTVIDDQNKGRLLDTVGELSEPPEGERKTGQEQAAATTTVESEKTGKAPAQQPGVASEPVQAGQIGATVEMGSGGKTSEPVSETVQSAARALPSQQGRGSEPLTLEPSLISEQDPAPDSELHQLVINAQRKQRARRGRSVLWLLAGAVVLGGATGGWLNRGLWLQTPPATTVVAGEPEVVPAPSFTESESQTPATKVGVSAVSVATGQATPEPFDGQPGAGVDAGDEQDGATQGRVALTGPAPIADLEVEFDEVDLRLPSGDLNQVSLPGSEAAVTETARQDAGLQGEAEQLARLKQESERLERERRAAEQEKLKLERERRAAEEEKLAQERAVREARERELKLERERRAAEEEKLAQERAAREARERELKLEQERRAAQEQKLALQRAARESMERKLKLERERRAEEKKRAEQLAAREALQRQQAAQLDEEAVAARRAAAKAAWERLGSQIEWAEVDE